MSQASAATTIAPQIGAVTFGPEPQRPSYVPWIIGSVVVLVLGLVWMTTRK
jgi:hypothetical protein